MKLLDFLFKNKKIKIPNNAEEFVKVYLEKINNTQNIDNQLIVLAGFIYKTSSRF